MNRKIFFLVFISSMLLLASCNNHENHSVLSNSDEYYTCSMDPQVIENKDGICPICHMKLIKAKKNTLKAGQIKLSVQQIKLANITFDTLRISNLTKEIMLTGKVTFDQNLSNAISTKIQGRIEKLAVKNSGDYIRKGQLLYEIYSEDINAAQLDYILAIQKSVSEELIVASKNKLLLYGMNEFQINQLKSSKNALQNISIYSSIDGFVSELSVAEGNYVTTGQTLFRLASFNSLWVEAQVYLPYLSYLKIGTEAHFNIPSLSDTLFLGKVIFIEPQVQSPNRFVLTRFQIQNPTQQIKPGMLANITLKTEMKKTLALPINAIIQDSKGAYVWIRNKDDVFENRRVKLGMQNSTQIEIVDGLQVGETVVVSGSYLLNSEYVFKKGTNSMAEHKNMSETIK